MIERLLRDARDINPPSRDDIVRELMITGDLLTSDFNVLKTHLDRVVPVRATFTITEQPPGFPPAEVRDLWVGLTLPIRGYFDHREGPSVLAREAMEILKAKSQAGYDWFAEYYSDMAKQGASNIDAEGYPEFLANMNFLVFDFYCADYSSNVDGT